MGGAASQHENELVLDVLRLSEPAFAVNGAHQIVAWNDGAERLLGLRAEEVIGMRCYEALSTTEGALCVDCRQRCGLSLAFVRGLEVNDPRALICTTQRGSKRVNVTTIPAQTRNGQLRVVHLLRDMRELPADETGGSGPLPRQRATPTPALPQAAAAQQQPEAAESGSRLRRPALLTQRELEVLRLLGAGHSTDDIARELSITRVTARNHVNKVLDKLGVNSRLQAVVIASQLQLI